MPHRAPGSPARGSRKYLTGRPIAYYRPTGNPAIRNLIENGYQAFNAGRLSEACRIFADKMLDPKNDTTIGLTIAGAMTPAGLGGCVNEMMERGLVDFLISTGANLYHDLHYALNFTLTRGSPFLDDRDLYAAGVIRIYDVLFPATVLLETDSYIRDFLSRSGMEGPVATSEFHYRLGRDLMETRPGCEDYSVVARAAKLGVPIYTSSPGDSSIGMNIAWHELMNDSRLMIDPNLDVNEVCAIILAGKKNGCVILGGGSPKNFYLQGQPTLWEVYGIPKGGNDYFIQITTDQVVWGGLSGATPSEAVSWGKVNPGVLPDTVVAYCDSTIAFPLFSEYAVGSRFGKRKRKTLYHQRETLVAELRRQGKVAAARRKKKKLINYPITNYPLPILMGSLAEQLRPIATDLAAAPRVYVDANLPAGVVAMMRSELAWDVLFVLEDDRLRRASDEEHFRLALEFGRTLITLDYDFCDDRRFPMASSPGVIVCSAPDEAALMRLLRHADRALLRTEPAAGLPLRGQKVELTPGVFSD